MKKLHRSTSATRLAATAGSPAEHITQRPIFFVVGNSRSGTTMLGRILQRSPDIHVFRELHFFERLWYRNDANRVLPDEEVAWLVTQLLQTSRTGVINARYDTESSEEALSLVQEHGLRNCTALELYQSFMRIQANSAKQGSSPCEQTPKNGFYLEEILTDISRSKVIRVTRDPRDVLVSQKRKWKRKEASVKTMTLLERVRLFVSYHPLIIGKLWVSLTSSTDAWLEHPRMHTIRFEDFVREPETHVRDLCTFLEIPYSEDLLDISRLGSSVREDDLGLRGVDADRAESWQRYGGINSAELFLCQFAARKKMEQHGYVFQQVFPNPVLLVYYLANFPLKVIAAILLNRGRMKNTVEAIKRRI
jgi:hypothetical protein